MPAAAPDCRADLHLHTHYSDGSAAPEAMVEAALARGLTRMAITDHMPLPFATRYAMPWQRLAPYRQELQELRQRYAGRIEILMGVELEWLSDQPQWVARIAAMGWDVCIGSVHGVACGGGHHMVNGTRLEFDTALAGTFGGDVRRFAACYFENLQQMLTAEVADVVGHLDVFTKHNRQGHYFDPSADWYQELVQQTLSLVARRQVALEINTGGLDHPVGAPYPAQEIIAGCHASGIRLVMGSDAHHPHQVARHFERFQPA
jgi:histidinol-phosphatase (PHP family)